jgi:hypothetical protein
MSINRKLQNQVAVFLGPLAPAAEIQWSETTSKKTRLAIDIETTLTYKRPSSKLRADQREKELSRA